MTLHTFCRSLNLLFYAKRETNFSLSYVNETRHTEIYNGVPVLWMSLHFSFASIATIFDKLLRKCNQAIFSTRNINLISEEM